MSYCFSPPAGAKGINENPGTKQYSIPSASGLFPTSELGQTTAKPRLPARVGVRGRERGQVGGGWPPPSLHSLLLWRPRGHLVALKAVTAEVPTLAWRPWPPAALESGSALRSGRRGSGAEMLLSRKLLWTQTGPSRATALLRCGGSRERRISPPPPRGLLRACPRTPAARPGVGSARGRRDRTGPEPEAKPKPGAAGRGRRPGRGGSTQAPRPRPTDPAARPAPSHSAGRDLAPPRPPRPPRSPRARSHLQGPSAQASAARFRFSAPGPPLTAWGSSGGCGQNAPPMAPPSGASGRPRGRRRLPPAADHGAGCREPGFWSSRGPHPGLPQQPPRPGAQHPGQCPPPQRASRRPGRGTEDARRVTLVQSGGHQPSRIGALCRLSDHGGRPMVMEGFQPHPSLHLHPLPLHPSVSSSVSS